MLARLLLVALLAAATTVSGAGFEIPAARQLVDADADESELYHGVFCGGVVVRPHQVLTAAHCVVGRRPNSVDVLIGGDDPCGDQADASTRAVVPGIRIHPQYRALTAAYDLAVLADIGGASSLANAIGMTSDNSIRSSLALARVVVPLAGANCG